MCWRTFREGEFSQARKELWVSLVRKGPQQWTDREEEGGRAQDHVQLGQQLGRRSRGREGGALLKCKYNRPTVCIEMSKGPLLMGLIPG